MVPTTTTFKADFVYSLLSHGTYSEPHTFQGFKWKVRLQKGGENMGVYLLCEPIQSTKEWMCMTSCTLTNITTGVEATNIIRKKFSNTNFQGWGLYKCESLEGLAKIENFTIEAKITVEETYLEPTYCNSSEI